MFHDCLRSLIALGLMFVAPALCAAEDSPMPQPKQTEATGERLMNTIGMQLRLLPAGEFQMGSRTSANDIAKLFGTGFTFFTAEYPQRRMKIAKPFYLGIHEVTRGQFATFVRESGYTGFAQKDDEDSYGYNAATDELEMNPTFNWRNPKFEQTDDHPVVNVSWNDAVAFCRWLSRKEGKTYRLPTSAEWEYACRAGTVTLYSHGVYWEDLVRVGNIADLSLRKANPGGFDRQGIHADDGFVFTAPVGTFQPNSFGLFDMHGNVSEWCQDTFAYSRSPLADPREALANRERVTRGGGWSEAPIYVRSSHSLGQSPEYRANDLGFRFVLER